MNNTKFRAWNKYKQVSHINTEIMEPVYIESGYMTYFTLEEGQNTPEEDYVIMQFTGLTDNNGIEIYEGDIISWSDKIYTVTWHEKIAGFIMKSATSLERPDIEFNSKVIGNIFEHKHLLK